MAKKNKFQIVTILVLCLAFLSFIPVVSAQSSSRDYNVLFDETRLYVVHGDGYEGNLSIYDTGVFGCSDFADRLRTNGFSVSKISSKPITYEKLKKYDVLMVMHRGGSYSEGEINAIKQFVEDGGGLFTADFDIAKQFGEVTHSYDGRICDPTDHFMGEVFGGNNISIPEITNIKSHAITMDVSYFYYIDGPHITNPSAFDVDVLAYTDNDAWFDSKPHNFRKDISEATGPFPVLLVKEYGKGRIVIFPSNSFSNSWLFLFCHPRLALNIVNWLTKGDTGAIHVNSGSLSANVYLDGVYKGETSPDISITEITKISKLTNLSIPSEFYPFLSPRTFTIYYVPVGTHKIKLTKEGYKDYSTTVTVFAGKTTNLSASLSLLPGSVRVSSKPSDAKIYLDGDYEGTTPETINDVPVGSHEVKITKFGYSDYTESITVESGKTAYVSVDLSLHPLVILGIIVSVLCCLGAGAGIYIKRSKRIPSNKIECENCHKEFDAQLKVCPYCEWEPGTETRIYGTDEDVTKEEK